MRKHFATATEIRSKSRQVNIDDAIETLNNAIKANDSQALNKARKKVAKLCPTGGPLVYCNANGTAQVVDSDTHSITLASTGKGKTRRFIYPSVFSDILAGTNIVVNDMKGEIYQTTKSLLAAMGYRVYVLDLRDPAHTPNHYNPLTPAWRQWHSGDYDRAFMTIRSLALCIFGPYKSDKDPFWSATAEDYFTGIALSMLEHGVDCDSFTIESIGIVDREGSRNAIPSMMEDPDLAPDDLNVSCIRLYDRCLKEDSRAHRFLSGTLTAQGNTIASILSIFRQPMSLYVGHRGLMNALGFSDFNAESLTRPKTAVFVISPDETRVFGPIVVATLNQLMSELITIAQSDHKGKLPYRVDFFLDEMGNLPSAIPDMDALVSAARSRNLRFHFVLQSIEQLSHVYGSNMSQIIQDNCDTWIYMGTKSLSFLSELSTMCGTVQMESGVQRQLLPVDVLQHLETRRNATETLVLLSSLRPYVTPLKDIGLYEQPYAMELATTTAIDSKEHSTYDFIGVVKRFAMAYERQLLEKQQNASTSAQNSNAAYKVDTQNVFSLQEEQWTQEEQGTSTGKPDGLFTSKDKPHTYPQYSVPSILCLKICSAEFDKPMVDGVCTLLDLRKVQASNSDYKSFFTAMGTFSINAIVLLALNSGQLADAVEVATRLTSLGLLDSLPIFFLYAKSAGRPEALPQGIRCLPADRSIDAWYITKKIIAAFAEDTRLMAPLFESMAATIENGVPQSNGEKEAVRDAINAIYNMRNRLNGGQIDRVLRICNHYDRYGLTYSQKQFLLRCCNQ